MLSGMRVLVTGGTGFIGSNLLFKLLDEGHEVFATGTFGEQNLSNFPVTLLPREIPAIEWNRIGPIAVLFHQAANNDTTELNREKMFRENVEHSLRLFQQALQHRCTRIVYASSTAVYGDVPPPHREEGPVHPLNPYAESKLALDEQAMAFARQHPGVTVVGLRYCNVYGPREAHKGKRASMVYQLAQQMVRGNPRIFRDGEQKRDYVYVSDVVRANLFAAKAPRSGIVNVGSGTATTFHALIQLLNEALGLQRVPEYIENPHTGRYQDSTLCDLTRTEELLHWQPHVDLREGIRRYLASGFLL